MQRREVQGGREPQVNSGLFPSATENSVCSASSGSEVGTKERQRQGLPGLGGLVCEGQDSPQGGT